MGTFRNEGMPEARTTERRRYRRRTRRDAPLSQKKSNKLWIWKAYCRDTGQLVDWECGDRDQNTLTRLLDRLKTWKVVLYCTDAYAPYDHALPVGRHFQGKEQTWRLEQNNGPQRHWYRRFQRRTLVVSKSVRMVDRTMAMFARFHVNGSLEDIAHLFGFPAIAAILGEGLTYPLIFENANDVNCLAERSPWSNRLI